MIIVTTIVISTSLIWLLAAPVVRYGQAERHHEELLAEMRRSRSPGTLNRITVNVSHSEDVDAGEAVVDSLSGGLTCDRPLLSPSRVRQST